MEQNAAVKRLNDRKTGYKTMNQSVIKTRQKEKKVRKNRRLVKGLIAGCITVFIVFAAARVPLGSGSAVAADEHDAKVLSVSQQQNLEPMEISAINHTSPRVDESGLIAAEEAEKERQRELEEQRRREMKPASEITSADTALPFGVALPEKAPVEDGYFEDAVFIGNSLMVGFSYVSDYDAQYFCTVGLNVSSYFSTVLPSGQTISQALAQTNFSKAYLMFGVNELGWSSAQAFTDYYLRVIEDIRAINPNAEIYVHSITPMNPMIWTGYDTVNNYNVALFNRAIAEMAQINGVHYVNIAEAYADESGALPAELTSDGVHMTTPAYKIWQEYLRTHTA